MRNQDTWVTNVAPAVGIDAVKLFSSDGKGTDALQSLQVGYNGDGYRFWNATTEDYMAHNVPVSVKGAPMENLSYNISNTFTYKQGSTLAPNYAAGLNAFGTATLRERREQIQDRAKGTMTYKIEDAFIRPTASLLYYNLKTQRYAATGAAAGYQNYVDRYDANGGTDIGYHFAEKFAGVIGYRYGRQYQGTVPFLSAAGNRTATNEYHRVLFGVEGNAYWDWLKVSLMAGPDFRTYNDNSDNTLATGSSNLTRPYWESDVSAEITKEDKVSFRTLGYQWVSSTGRVSYFDHIYQVGYQRKITDDITASVSLRAWGADYDYGTTRSDWLYTGGVGVVYKYNKNLSFGADYAHDWARNQSQDISQAAEYGRNFDRNVVSIFAKLEM